MISLKVFCQLLAFTSILSKIEDTANILKVGDLARIVCSHSHRALNKQH